MQFVRAKNHHILARAHTHTDEFNVQEGSDSDNEHAFHDGLCRRHFFVSFIIQFLRFVDIHLAHCKTVQAHVRLRVDVKNAMSYSVFDCCFAHIDI